MPEHDEHETTPEMGDWERLCHYTFGMMHGVVQGDTASLGRAWEEYRRLGGDPEADPWPVTSLAPSASDELLARSRELREALAEHMSEHGPSVDVSRADKALAALLGEEPFKPERPEQEAEPEAVVAGDTCARCEVMDGVTVTLTERDGRPYCARCHTDGSGGSL